MAPFSNSSFVSLSSPTGGGFQIALQGLSKFLSASLEPGGKGERKCGRRKKQLGIHKGFASALCFKKSGMAMYREEGVLYLPEFLSGGVLYSYKKNFLVQTF